MRTVLKEMGIRRAVKGDIGVEIEVEGENLPVMDLHWRNEEDGSLKALETREYVLKVPSSLKGVKEALDALDKAYNSNDTVVYDSVRAGVHIHINCQHLTMTQLYSFMTVYLVLENLLVKWCGEYREGNLFCLRACDAEYLISELQKAAQDNGRNFRARFHTDDLRYGSMNVKALGDYGSLEFRAMRGTRDLDLIYTWAETLLGLREFACTFKSPQEVVEQFSMMGAEDFTKAALGSNYESFQCKDLYRLVWDGLRNAQDVAYSTPWDTFDPKYKTIGGLDFPEELGHIDEPLEDY